MPDIPDAAHAAAITGIVTRPGVVVVLGGVDSGKTTLVRRILAAGLRAGLRTGYVDTDLGQSRVGPPTAIGLRHVRAQADLDDPFLPDGCAFVGDISPRGHLLPLVTGTGRLTRAAAEVADLVVVDTSGYVRGPAAEVCKFHKLELTRPAHVVGLQREDELEALLGIARRFTRAHVVSLPVHPDVVPASGGQRAERRRAGLARYFDTELTRMQVSAEAFMPSLPPDYDLGRLHGILAGLEDGGGHCLGVGVLERVDGILRVATPARNGRPRGLRLGAVRVDDRWRPERVDHRALLDRR